MTARHGRALARAFLSIAGLASCGPAASIDAAPAPPPPAQAGPIPAQGTAATLDVGNWNLDWFGATGNGPTDEALQLRNVATVMGGVDLDLWGLEEVVDRTQFRRLVGALPGSWAGLLANDPRVRSGPAYYSGFGDKEQKVALVWRTDEVTLDSARVILGAYDHAFAGRPPVEFHLHVSIGGRSEPLIVIVQHAKAGADAGSLARRDTAAAALERYLGATWPTAKVLVIGDFNDDVDASIHQGAPSPYRSFVEDSADYRFPTAAISAAHIGSTVKYPDVIDHQLDSNEMFADYVPGSAEVFRADRYIADYGETTSDHYPVMARYRVK